MGVMETQQVRVEIVNGLKDLPGDKLKEVLEFVLFLKVREVIDPTQAYFWTKKWQKMEKEVEENKEKGRVIGNGTVKGLLKKLKSED